MTNRRDFMRGIAGAILFGFHCPLPSTNPAQTFITLQEALDNMPPNTISTIRAATGGYLLILDDPGYQEGICGKWWQQTLNARITTRHDS